MDLLEIKKQHGRIIYFTLLTKLNFIHGNSFCWLGCWNISVLLPEDGPLMVETWRSHTMLMKWC